MSGREWKPGDVAIRTGKDGGEVRTMVAVKPSASLGGCLCTPHARHDAPHWHHANGRWNPIPDDPESGTYRPLVVIDPEDREAARHLAWLVQQEIDAIPYKHVNYSAELTAAGQRALRRLSAPPKPDEPTGLGAVVEDAVGNRWVRVNVQTGTAEWRSCDYRGLIDRWPDVPAVRVLSEGVTP